MRADLAGSLGFFAAVLADFATHLSFLTAMETRQGRVVPLKVGDRLHSGASRERNQREHAKCDEHRNDKPPENHHGNQPAIWEQFETSVTPVSHKVRLLPTMSSKKTLRRPLRTLKIKQNHWRVVKNQGFGGPGEGHVFDPENG